MSQIALTSTRAVCRVLFKFSIQINLDDFPVPASTQVSLQRSRPRRLSGPSERPSRQRRLSGPSEHSGIITTISPSGPSERSRRQRRLSGPSERSGVITTISSQDDFPVLASVQVSLQPTRPRRLPSPSEHPSRPTRFSGPSERRCVTTTI